MHFIAETLADGVVERTFALSVEGDRVPGVVWTAAGASSGLPVLLMGHGGSQHKRAPAVAIRARSFVSKLKIAVAAIDAPGHGERAPSAHVQAFVATLQQKMARGEPIGPLVARENARQALQAVPEWQATLDALQALQVLGEGQPVGYWGLSLGAAIGVPLVASEPRIRAAVLGLVGLLPDDEALAVAAAKIQVAVEYLMQWDDELVPREASFAHAVRLPEAETESWLRFFARHLVA